MNIQKIIDKIETRKKNTKAFQIELPKVFDFLTGLNIDVDLHSKNIKARYELCRLFDNIKRNSRNPLYGEELVIAIKNGQAGLYDVSETDIFERIAIHSIEYFNMGDMQKAIHSILTQLENMSDKGKNLEDTKKLIQNFKGGQK